jgi:predicted RNA binding protein YcfA (HicA-like mRNA interferase family)
MPPLPVLRGREVVSAFEALGWTVARQRGSHIIMVKEGSMVTLAIPDHKEVARGTLRSLIRAAGITAQEFLDVCEGL